MVAQLTRLCSEFAILLETSSSISIEGRLLQSNEVLFLRNLKNLFFLLSVSVFVGLSVYNHRLLVKEPLIVALQQYMWWYVPHLLVHYLVVFLTASYVLGHFRREFFISERQMNFFLTSLTTMRALFATWGVLSFIIFLRVAPFDYSAPFFFRELAWVLSTFFPTYYYMWVALLIIHLWYLFYSKYIRGRLNSFDLLLVGALLYLSIRFLMHLPGIF